jgi:spore coat polysaccharide biosynthesis protein SpsF (cytidylyltransferase family)
LGSKLPCVDENIAFAIQARLSSKRFPGKVLVELQGKTIIEHVLNSVAKLSLPCFVLTSNHSSDDQLVEFLRDKGQEVFRGPLEDVLGRYVTFVETFPFSNLIRISADSPLIHPEVVSKIVQFKGKSKVDVVTNVYPRTFPKGQSVEVLNCESIIALNEAPLLEYHREHVTSFIYENPAHFKINNYLNTQDLSGINMCVDIPEDLVRIQRLLDELDLSLFEGLPSWSDLCDMLALTRI